MAVNKAERKWVKTIVLIYTDTQKNKKQNNILLYNYNRYE